MPVKSEPRQKSRKEPCISPMAPMAAPTAPPVAVSAKPARRPWRCMKAASGVAVSMEPSTISEIGSVAQQMLVASDWPASPATTKIIGICAPRIACAATSTATLRLARESGATAGAAGWLMRLT